MSKDSNTGTNVVIIVLAVVIVVLAFAFIGEHNSNKATQTSATQSSTTQTQTTNQPLQNCMNQAHQQWDGVIATAEGTPGNAYDFDKSQLDQRIVGCHQQYGY